MNQKIKTLFLIAISCAFGLQSCKDNSASQKSITKEISFTNEGRLTVFKKNTDEAISTFKIETAIGDYETETGLMHRKSMPNDCGMLFMFDNEQPRSFYMKNTIIELDILYIDANKKIVKIYRKATPYSTQSLPSEVPIKYVLEVNGAISSSLGIVEGDRVEWDLKQD